MANLLAAAAKGIAIGHERDMAHKQDLEKYDHQAAHAQTLEELRSKNNLANTELQNEYATGQATVRSEHEIARQEMDWDWKDTDREDTQAHALELQLGNAYLQQQKSTGTVKSHGWSLNTEMIEVFDPDNPLAPPTEKPVTIMHSDNLGAFSSVGDKLYRTGDPTQPRLQLTPEQQRTEEARLLENLGDHRAEQAFYDEFGYIPMMYAIRLRQSSDSGMREFIDKNMRRSSSTQPVRGGGGGGRGPDQAAAQKIFDEGGSGGTPSIAGMLTAGGDAEDAARLKQHDANQAAERERLGGSPDERASVLREAAAAEATPQGGGAKESVESEGELSDEQAQEIADAVAAIKRGEPPGPTAAQRIGGGIKSWITGGWRDDVGMWVSGADQKKLDAMQNPDDKAAFIAELKRK